MLEWLPDVVIGTASSFMLPTFNIARRRGICAIMRYETITTSRLLNDCIVSYTSQVVSAPLGTMKKWERIIEDDYIELITSKITRR
jgi:hypothetical protein